MGLTSIPTETDGSLGRDKVDADPVPNLDEFVPAAEWNALKRAVGEVCAAVGLADGTTAGSIEARLAGGVPSTPVFVDDFSELDTTHRWSLSDSLSGATSHAAADEANLADPSLGFGWIELSAPSESDQARLDLANPIVVGAHNPTLRVRFQLPTFGTTAVFRIGMQSDNAEAAIELVGSTGMLRADTGSALGGASGTGDLMVGVAQAVYDLTIVVVSETSVAYTLQRVDGGGSESASYTETNAARVCRDGEAMGPFAVYSNGSGANPRAYVDHFTVSATRAG